jgi:hypothetical protein
MAQNSVKSEELVNFWHQAKTVKKYIEIGGKQKPRFLKKNLIFKKKSDALVGRV